MSDHTDSGEEGVGSDKESEQSECLHTSPFEIPDPATDLTLIVEDKELHFCKSFLKASSPVFEKMFNSDFKEKNSDRVPLPDKTYKDMDIFLQQLHPVHSWKPLDGND